MTLLSLIHRYAADYALAVDITKGVIAAVSALCLLHEARRARQGRPIAERWKRRAAVGLSVAAVAAYFNGLRIDYPFYHRWEHYHYYLGAKYFPEMGYDNLYKCTVIAQDEIGSVTYTDERAGQRITLDMSAEVRRPGRKIRNIGVDNLLMDVGGILDHPETCKAHFSPERLNCLGSAACRRSVEALENKIGPGRRLDRTRPRSSELAVPRHEVDGWEHEHHGADHDIREHEVASCAPSF